MFEIDTIGINVYGTKIIDSSGNVYTGTLNADIIKTSNVIVIDENQNITANTVNT
jgi:hypothetical protein